MTNAGSQYLYHVLRDQSRLPVEALYMIRYHSFYPYVFLARLLSSCERYELNRTPSWHRGGAYKHLCNAEDEKALAAVKAFNPYDLYSKSDEPVKVEKVKPYYQGLIAKYFPDVIEW